MKFVADRAPLAAALKSAARIIERSTIPILETAKLSISETGIEIVATDMDVWLTRSVAGEGSGCIVCCPKIAAFSGFVSASDAERVELEVTDAITVRCGPASAVFPLLPPDNFPVSKQDSKAVEFPVDGLSRLIEFTLPFASTDPSRNYLNGVYLHKTNEGLAACATDGNALGLIRMPAELPDFPGIIIPTKTVALICDDPGEVRLSVSERRITIAGAGYSIASRLIDGTFPDYDRVIAPRVERPVSFAAGEFLAAVRQLESAVDIEGRRGHRGIKLSIGSRDMEMSAGVAGSGTARTSIACSYGGEPREIGFSGRYLKIAAETIGKDADIELHFIDPVSPTRLCEAGQTLRQVTLMPYRV